MSDCLRDAPLVGINLKPLSYVPCFTRRSAVGRWESNPRFPAVTATIPAGQSNRPQVQMRVAESRDVALDPHFPAPADESVADALPRRLPFAYRGLSLPVEARAVGAREAVGGAGIEPATDRRFLLTQRVAMWLCTVSRDARFCDKSGNTALQGRFSVRYAHGAVGHAVKSRRGLYR